MNKIIHFRYLILLSVLISGVLTGCKKEGCTDPQALNYDADAEKSCDDCCVYSPYGTVKFKFTFSVDGQPAEWDTMKFTNPAGRLYRLETLKFYVSDFKFKYDGGEYATEDVIYVDARDPDFITGVIDSVPNRQYTSISLIIGLDEDTNVPGGLPPTQENINMLWPPGDGEYHYMKLEGKYLDDNGNRANFNTHFGATGTNPNVIHNYVVIEDLPNSAFEVKHNTVEITLDMNINEWYKNPVLYDFPDYGQAIMMNQQAQSVLKQNGVDVFSVSDISNN